MFYVIPFGLLYRCVAAMREFVDIQNYKHCLSVRALEFRRYIYMYMQVCLIISPLHVYAYYVCMCAGIGQM